MQPATILPRNPKTPIKQKKKNADPPESIKKLHRHPQTKSYVQEKAKQIKRQRNALRRSDLAGVNASSRISG